MLSLCRVGVRLAIVLIAIASLQSRPAHSAAAAVPLVHESWTFRDDGKGIDPEVLRKEGREGHFGLHGMRERATLAGGKLTIWSGPDDGTEIELSIPAAHAYSKASPTHTRGADNVMAQEDISDS